MIQVALAILADLFIGDRCIGMHPVIMLGKLIEWLEGLLYGKTSQRIRGFIFTVLTLLATGAVVFIIESIVNTHIILQWTVGIYLMYLIPSAKSLRDFTEAIIPSLDEDDLTVARQQIGMLVGRDTETLTKDEIVRAAIETSSENTIDGLVAPVFYMAIGSLWGHGLLFGYLYKAINTLDSMVGYKNERYLKFGYFSAKLDDLANLLPARLGSMMMLLVGKILRYDAYSGWLVFLRDRKNHKSPNSGHPESVTAGLLGIQLGGDSRYFGKMVSKPTIGHKKKDLEASDIRKSNRILYGVAYMLVLLLIIGGLA